MIAPRMLPVPRERPAEAAHGSRRSPLGTGRPVVVPPRTPSIHHAIRLLFHPLFRVYFGMRGEGFEHLPAYGPFVIAANHVSMLDWAFLSYFLRWQVRFLVDRSYWDHPQLGTWMRFNGAVPVRAGRPDPSAIRLACAVLSQRRAVDRLPRGADLAHRPAAARATGHHAHRGCGAGAHRPGRHPRRLRGLSTLAAPAAPRPCERGVRPTAPTTSRRRWP